VTTFAYDDLVPYGGGETTDRRDVYPVGSVETVGIRVTADHDVPSISVEVCVHPAGGTPGTSARWVVPDLLVRPTARVIDVRVTIGPGSTWGPLGVGVYRLWARVDDAGPPQQRPLVDRPPFAVR
jgi:hypothetical protein